VAHPALGAMDRAAPASEACLEPRPAKGRHPSRDTAYPSEDRVVPSILPWTQGRPKSPRSLP
jgi:hypothetical protein